MTEEVQEVVEVEEVSTPDVPVEAEAATEQEQEAQVDTKAIEEEARKIGWVPESEFKGDKKPAKFFSAEEFIERGNTVLPIVRSQLERERAAREEDRKSFDSRVEKMERMAAESAKRAAETHKAELARVKAEMRKAVADGDTQTYDDLEKQHDDLAKNAPGEAGTESNEVIQNNWIAQNSWYTSDFEANSLAQKYSEFISQGNPNMTLAENLAKTEAFVREKRPELFGEVKAAPKTPKAPSVEGGTTLNGMARDKETLSSTLPAEALRQAKADVSAGHYKTTDEWAKVYFQK